MDDLLQHLAGLAPEERELFILLAREEGVDLDRLPIPRRGPDDPAPLSFAQERVWFLEQLEPGTPAYNAAVALEAAGRLDEGALRRAVDEIARRHEALRTGVAMREGGPEQQVTPAAAVPFAVIDLRGLTRAAAEAAAARVATEEARRPFPLERGPLLRAALLRLDDTRSRLLLVTHHLAADGWSMGVLVGELAALYSAETALPEPPLQYADFALWQRRRMEAGLLDGELEHWVRRLEGAPRLLELPTDRPRRPVDSPRGATLRFPLSADLAVRLEAFGRRRGTTPFMTLLAAFQALLGRISGQDDLVVATAVSNRSRPELEGLIGPFANDLLLRAGLAGDPAFPDFLAQVRDTVLEAQAHQDLPFERLVRALQPERGLGRQALFQAVFVLHESPWEVLELPGLSLRWLPVDLGVARFDLTLEVVRGRDGYLALLEHNRELFEAPTAARLAGQLLTLLEAAVGEEAHQLSELPLLSAAERFQLTAEWNDVRSDYPRDEPVHRLFEAWAERTPEAVALDFGGREMTYAELDARAGGLARRLVETGLDPEARVALCTERSAAMVIGALGILKAGAAYVPLDPVLPRERMALILEDAGVTAVVAQPHLASHLPEHPVPRIGLEEDDPLPAERGLSVAVDSRSLAYAMYTSGSTGRPKGVMVPHRAVARLVRGSDYVSLRPDDRVAQASNTSFDAATFEVWGALLAGARLVGMERDLSLAPRELAAWLRERSITTLFLTTALFNQIAAEVPDAFAGLRHLLFGGQAVDPLRVRQVLAQGPPERLLHVYGPTESTTFATWHRVCEVAPDAVTIPIGLPLANTTLHVLDGFLLPVPIGVPGELCLGGDGLARGYLGSPDRTAERFVPDPLAESPGERLYRTGDRVRRLPDGAVEFLGRFDDQVKIRGFRIEPGEVETVLAGYPEVRQVAVVARETAPGEKRLVAYVAGDAPSVTGLRRFLQERLPDYMIPAAFVPLPALPLNPNGKVDRRALPEPGADRSFAGAGFVPPEGPMEQALAEVWCEVLGLDRVGRHDNFFELGGDSILALQIVSRAQRAGLGITAKQLFQHQSLAELAVVATLHREPETAREEETGGPVPLTPIQRWFFEQNLPRPHWFHQEVLLEVLQPLAPEVLEEALSALVAHHAALRLRFHRDGDGWRQEIAPVSTLDDLGSSLDLERGPLLQATLFAPGADRLGIVIHHLGVDGVSWRVLLEDLQTACLQIARGEPVRLAPVGAPFRRWAEGLEALARSGALDSEIPFWLRQARPASLPLDHPEGANTVAASRTVTVTLDAGETAALLQEVPRAYRTRIDDALLTALSLALAGWTGSPEVLVDLERHGRDGVLPDLDLSRTVGWLTAIAPVLLRPGSPDDPGGALKAVKEQLRAIPRGGAGYGVLRYLGDEETAAALRALPPAQVSFNYLGQLDLALPAGGLFRLLTEGAGHGRAPEGERRHLLEVNAFVTGGRLQVDWVYGGELHERTTVEALAASFLAALRELVAHCRSPHAWGYTRSDFPAAGLSQEELDALVRRAARGGRLDIESIDPLSPVQEGILLHTLSAPGTGVYFEQLSCELRGELDPEAFRRAWQRAVDRQPVLRTLFAWEGLPRPLQVVLERAELPWQNLDWRDLPPAGRSARLDEFLAEDEARGFDLGAAPLLRAALIRWDAASFRFVWSFHHLLLDGWSVARLLRDVFADHEALRRGEERPLPPAPAYRGFLAWLERRDRSADEAFWREALRGVRAPTPLGIEAPAGRGASAGTRFGQRELHLGESATAALHELAARGQVTLNTLVQGAWALLLGRSSGERDVVFGTVAAGRPPELPDVESTLGVFLDTLPVRVALPSGASLAGWLRGLQAGQVELRQHEHTPLVDIHGWSEVPRGTPLFETLLVFENYPLDASLLRGDGGVAIGAVRLVEKTHYPVTLVAVPGSSLLLRIAYDEHRLDETAALRLLARLATGLEGLPGAWDRALADLPLLPAAERHQVLVEWSGVGVGAEPGPAPCLHQAFARQAARTPEAVALVCGEERLSYRDLDRRAGRVARRLRGLGVGPEARVAICAERSPALVAGLLGILKAGGAYVPLDPAYPAQRLSFLLEDARAALVLTTRAAASALPPSPARTLFLEDLEEGEPEHIEGGAGPESPAYVIYTSGSTGLPKGAEILHRGAAALLAWAAEAYAAEDLRGVLASTSVCFDLSVFELFVPLSRGGTVVLADNPLHLPAAASSWEVTLINTVPSAADDLRRLGAIPPSVRVVNLAGEPLPARLAQDLYAQPGIRAVVNLYGPTEDTTYSTEAWLPRDTADPVPIGRPLPGGTAWVLDRDLLPVPLGAPGELYLGGAGLARGYLGRPDLTAERFIPDPFGDPTDRSDRSDRSDRLYRTGDRARWLPGGALEFLGRIDHQVKVRGFRVEPGEVEAALAAHPAVREAAVVAHRFGPDDLRLVAYAAVDGGPRPVAGELRAFLRRRLPELMVPNSFVFLEALPRTPNGKLDRRALPAPDSSRPELEVAFRPPHSPLERTLAEIWQEVLGVERVGVEDPFFDLGGHSLLLLRVHGRLCQRLGRDIPITDLFRYPTVASLAAHLSHDPGRDDLEEVRGEALRQRAARQRRRQTLGEEPWAR